MKLIITTPFRLAVDESGVAAIEAEDATGRFGMLPRHADFLAVLVPSVVSWQMENGDRRYCAIHGGILTVGHGDIIAVSSRDAVPGDDLVRLEREVVTRFTRRREEEVAARAATERMMLSALRQIIAFVRPNQTPRL